MIILIDTSKIAYFSRYFWTISEKLIRYYITMLRLCCVILYIILTRMM